MLDSNPGTLPQKYSMGALPMSHHISVSSVKLRKEKNVVSQVTQDSLMNIWVTKMTNREQVTAIFREQVTVIFKERVTAIFREQVTAIFREQVTVIFREQVTAIFSTYTVPLEKQQNDMQ